MLAGTVTVGGVVSCTVTTKESEPVLLWESVAVQVTVVVPSGNVLPDAGAQLGAMLPSTMSLAEAEYVTTAPPGPVAAVVMLAGTVTVGGVVSCTVTTKESEPVLLWESVAVQVTVVVPKPNVLPDAGEQPGEMEPSTMSEAEAE
jgi:hypothetical protein